SFKLNGASLVVATMATTPGFADLDGVEAEAEEIVRVFANSSTKPLHLPHPSAQQVLENLESCNMIHFAGHGQSVSDNPLESHLLLQRKDAAGNIRLDKLTVRSITQKMTAAASIAFLSGCLTADNPAPELADEVIHLAS